MRERCETEALAYVKQIHTLEAEVDTDKVTLEEIEASPVRCPDQIISPKMAERIDQARRDRDSLGGIIESVCRNVPVGLGEPVFDKLKADLAKAMMSLPATMGFQIGSGFDGITMTGSEHNDEFYNEDGGFGRGQTILGVYKVVSQTAKTSCSKLLSNRQRRSANHKRLWMWTETK